MGIGEAVNTRFVNPGSLSVECYQGDTSWLLRRDCGEESVAQPGIEKPRGWQVITAVMAVLIAQNLCVCDIDSSPV